MHTTSTLTRRRAPTVPAHRRANTDDRLAAVPVSGGISRPPAMIDRQSVVALQRTHGNAAVGRLLQRQRTSQATTPLIQRYPVDVPCNADCDTLLNWLDTTNPYAGDGNWAQTTCDFNVRKGTLNVRPYEVEGITYFRVRLNRPRVAVRCSVDMPEWEPCNRAMRAAWRAASRHLRQHEGEHEDIGEEHRTIMAEFLTELDIYTDATNRADAIEQANESIDRDLEWLEDEQQKAQEAIDPFRAPLDCPDEETEASAAGSFGDVIGGLAGWFGGETSNQGASGASMPEAGGVEPVATNAEKPSDGGGWISDLFPAGGDKDEEDAGSWWS